MLWAKERLHELEKEISGAEVRRDGEEEIQLRDGHILHTCGKLGTQSRVSFLVNR